jgi:FixJ family two-component response regulator
MPAKQGGRQGDALGAGNPFDDDVTSDSKTRPPVSTATTFNPFDMWDRETKAGDVDFSSQPFDQFEQDKALTTKSQAATATATAEPDFFFTRIHFIVTTTTSDY